MADTAKKTASSKQEASNETPAQKVQRERFEAEAKAAK